MRIRSFHSVSEPFWTSTRSDLPGLRSGCAPEAPEGHGGGVTRLVEGGGSRVESVIACGIGHRLGKHLRSRKPVACSPYVEAQRHHWSHQGFSATPRYTIVLQGGEALGWAVGNAQYRLSNVKRKVQRIDPLCVCCVCLFGWRHVRMDVWTRNPTQGS